MGAARAHSGHQRYSSRAWGAQPAGRHAAHTATRVLRLLPATRPPCRLCPHCAAVCAARLVPAHAGALQPMQAWPLVQAAPRQHPGSQHPPGCLQTGQPGRPPPPPAAQSRPAHEGEGWPGGSASSSRGRRQHVPKQRERVHSLVGRSAQPGCGPAKQWHLSSCGRPPPTLHSLGSTGTATLNRAPDAR